MRSDGAREGDRVRVCWAGEETLEGTVRHVPCATGDAWIVMHDDGDIYHIQQYECILVLGRKAGVANAEAHGRGTPRTVEPIVGKDKEETK